jgi:hypothetical protein
MPKATLEFNLPEETSEYRAYIEAPAMLLVLLELDNRLRSLIKYHPESQPTEVIFQELRDMITEEIDIYAI